MTDRYAVIGNPVEHSKSPFIHAQFALQTGEDIEYERILGDPQRFAEETRRFLARGGRGLNVTVPFKEAAWRLADELSPQAQTAQAVNTLIPLRGGRLRGDNTDGVGLVRDLADNWGYQLAGSRVLLLGAGGAASGVAGPLLASAPALLVIANRTASRARRLAARLSDAGPVHGCGFDRLAGQQFDLIINATAAGLRDQVPAIPGHLLAGGGWTYDMMYGTLPTAFVEWGRAQGADNALDGLGMLVEQAAESFWLWRGVRPDTGPVIRLLAGP